MATLAMQPQRKIEIPYGSGDEVLELEVANLPEPQESVGILQEQDCKIQLWTQLAHEYYRQGQHDAFELLLTQCLTKWDENRAKTEAELNNDKDILKERVGVLDMLATYYVRKANQTKNRDQKRNYLAKSTQNFTVGDKSLNTLTSHGPEFQYHIVCRAYAFLLEGRYDQADDQFGFVLQQQHQSNEPENVASLLGRACIEFNKKEATGKRAALALYKKALQVCPNCPADVRLGMGICFYKLNMQEKAEAAFSRALALDQKCVGALAGLAVIELNRKTGYSIKRGIEYLSRAFKIEPNNALVLTLLADHFFYANELEKAIKLATRAQENTENEAMQAQACFQLGRAYHRQRDYERAFEFYYKATTFGGPQSFLAFYGLGQMYIYKREFDAAIQAFETVLKTNPDNYETLKVLASLYTRNQTKKDVARQYLKKVTESHPEDVEAWVELASLCEQNDTQTALSAYKTSIKLYEAKSASVPAELYNNLAALLFSIDSLEESEHNYNLALKRCEEELATNRTHYESIIYTIKYNLGRLQEAKHDSIAAESTYKEILIAHPMYIDCYLRLGCIERDKGLLFDASDRFKATFRTEPNNVDAWTLIGNLHYSKSEWMPCQKKFDRILEKTSPPDVYSLISIGNVFLQTLYLTSKNDKDKLERCRSKALLFYKNALQHDSKNIYAANGIGCLFAIKGLANEARDIFSQVREATADFPDVWINIAHIYVEQHQYAAAVQMYDNCLRKFYNNSNTEILLYIARALYKANKLMECKKVLLRARYLSPYDLVVLFNLAKLLKTLARQIFEDRKSTYHAVITAELELKLARSYFQHYIRSKSKTRSESDRNYIDSQAAEIEERDAADLLLQVERSIKVDAEQRDREESQRRLEHERQLELEKAKKAEEEEKRALEERQKKEELESKRRELLKRQEESKQKLLEEKLHGRGDDGSDEGSSRRKKPKTKKKDKGERADRERERQERERSLDNKKYKSRAILSSDSSSSDEDNDAGMMNDDEEDDTHKSDQEVDREKPISDDSDDDDRPIAATAATGADDDDDEDDDL